MFCKHCGNKIADDSKFCQYCGGKVLEEESVEEETHECECCCHKDEEVEKIYECLCEDEAVEAEEIVDKIEENKEEANIETVQEECSSDEESKEWYYVENQASKGPFSESEMNEFVSSNVLSGSSLVWKIGMQDWVKLSETDLYVAPVTEDTMDEDAVWYYVENKDSKGPYTKAEMDSLIEKGLIKGNTYVWRSGMEDWKHMKDTELASNSSNDKCPVEPVVEFKNTNLNITNRSIGLAIILSICTCGLYTFYWLYCIARDINTIAKSQGKEETMDAGLVLILSIVTCSLFLLYYYYKAGKVLKELELPNGNHPNDDGIVLMVLGFFGLDIISYCILQSTINDFAK